MPAAIQDRFPNLIIPSDAEFSIPPLGLTANEGFPAAEAMLEAVHRKLGLESGRVGKVGGVAVFGVAFDGNSCNMHIDTQLQHVARAINMHPSGIMLAQRASEIGVSDGIGMGHDDMRNSLPSREHIADGVEIAAGMRQYLAWVGVGGCDKNYPALVMGAGRVRKPFYMINGGTIMPGHTSDGREVDVVSSFEANGQYRTDRITLEERDEVIQCSIPGEGACGGMYTANTMVAGIEALGLMIPGTGAIPAIHPQKFAELRLAGDMTYHLLRNNILPQDIITKASFDNSTTVAMALGGSTNIVLHNIAMAAEFGIQYTYDDIQRISDRTPVLADMKPNGKYHMNALYEAGGIPAVMRYLADMDLIHTDAKTVTGRTVGENLAIFDDLAEGQQVIRNRENPIKPEGHIQILYGNIAPDGAVFKITGENAKRGYFEGDALVYDSEAEAIQAFDKDPADFKGRVIVVRYVGPEGASGMPEMLAITSRITGAGLDEECALLTDGRFSGGTHGFCGGHIAPEAYTGGNIALLRNGDRIVIDVRDRANKVYAEVSDEEFAQRRETWERIVRPVNGFLAKYRAMVRPAYLGATTNPNLRLN